MGEPEKPTRFVTGHRCKGRGPVFGSPCLLLEGHKGRHEYRDVTRAISEEPASAPPKAVPWRVGQVWETANRSRATVLQVDGHVAQVKAGGNLYLFNLEQRQDWRLLQDAPTEAPKPAPGHLLQTCFTCGKSHEFTDQAVTCCAIPRIPPQPSAYQFQPAPGALKMFPCIRCGVSLESLSASIEHCQASSARQVIEARKKKPEPWRPSVDDWDLLPDA
jgi:hypothetical protein